MACATPGTQTLRKIRRARAQPPKRLSKAFAWTVGAAPLSNEPLCGCAGAASCVGCGRIVAALADRVFACCGSACGFRAGITEAVAVVRAVGFRAGLALAFGLAGSAAGACAGSSWRDPNDENRLPKKPPDDWVGPAEATCTFSGAGAGLDSNDARLKMLPVGAASATSRGGLTCAGNRARNLRRRIERSDAAIGVDKVAFLPQRDEEHLIHSAVDTGAARRNRSAAMTTGKLDPFLQLLLTTQWAGAVVTLWCPDGNGSMFTTELPALVTAINRRKNAKFVVPASIIHVLLFDLQ